MSEKEQSFLDETRFLRRVRWRSTVRTALIALAVVIVSFALLWVCTRRALVAQENRISFFYPQLVRYSTPNTIAIPGPGYDVGWLGRQKEYILVRMVGGHPVFVGTAKAIFQVWGGEQFFEPSQTMIRVEGGPTYLLPGAVPELRFYSPAVEHQEGIPRQFDKLAGIPEDRTVEMALSFSRLVTRQEIEGVLPRGVEPLWGAIAAYGMEDIEEARREDPWRAYSLAHRIVGIPLGGFREGEPRIREEDFPAELRRLSEIPSYSSDLLKRTAEYLAKNGIRYYGVVVEGKPGDLGKLAQEPLILGAVLGCVVD